MNKTAILIDDEPHVCKIINVLLTSLNVEILGVANNGKEGLELFNKKLPHLVFLDINMPDIEGSEVLNSIKKQSPGTKVIILSSVNNKSKIEEIIDQGADYYILKGNDLSHIQDQLKKIVS